MEVSNAWFVNEGMGDITNASLSTIVYRPAFLGVAMRNPFSWIGLSRFNLIMSCSSG